MSMFSKALPLVAFAAVLAPRAHAGACCVGSTSTVPLRLGECEHMLAAFGVGAERSVGLWTSDGQVAESSLQDDALVGTVGAAWRWDRKGQVGLSMPGRLNHKATSSLDTWGGGAGDLRVTALWDPFEEKPALAEGPALPMPLFSLGFRAPTGRSWDRSESPLGEDITGLPGPAVLAGVSLERTLDRMPWSVEVDTEVGREGLAGDRHLQPALTAAGSLGRYIGTHWSLAGTLVHQRSWTLDPENPGQTSKTTAGLKVATGRPMAWRAWAGVDGDLPVSKLGSSNMRMVRAGLGMAIVR